MTIAETLLLDFDTEISNTRRTLERLPDTLDPAWAAHAKSMPVGKLAMHCAYMPIFGHYIVEDEGMNLADPNPKRTHADLTWKGTAAALTAIDGSAAKCKASLEAAPDELLKAVWRFSFGDHVISEVSRAETYRMMCFNHLIHHTAQLGVYLRLLDIPVPALYGPSADEPWAPK